MDKKILIVIPTFNEEAVIGSVISRIKKSFDPADILVVNDGSHDKTAQAAQDAGVEIISLPFNLGYGSALEAGYKYAYLKGYEYVVQLDADGQHEPRCIAELLEPVEKGQADLVIGSRFLRDIGYQTTWVRRLGRIIFAKITSFLIKQKITDSTSGFQAFNRRVLTFFVGGFYPSDYPDADVIIILNRSGFSIKEIPVVMYASNNKKSMHAGLIRPLYYIFKMFLSISMIFFRKKTKI
jgi:hypothetical protein